MSQEMAARLENVPLVNVHTLHISSIPVFPKELSLLARWKISHNLE